MSQEEGSLRIIPKLVLPKVIVAQAASASTTTTSTLASTEPFHLYSSLQESNRPQQSVFSTNQAAPHANAISLSSFLLSLCEMKFHDLENFCETVNTMDVVEQKRDLLRILLTHEALLNASLSITSMIPWLRESQLISSKLETITESQQAILGSRDFFSSTLAEMRNLCIPSNYNLQEPPILELACGLGPRLPTSLYRLSSIPSNSTSSIADRELVSKSYINQLYGLDECKDYFFDGALLTVNFNDKLGCKLSIFPTQNGPRWYLMEIICKDKVLQQRLFHHLSHAWLSVGKNDLTWIKRVVERAVLGQRKLEIRQKISKVISLSRLLTTITDDDDHFILSLTPGTIVKCSERIGIMDLIRHNHPPCHAVENIVQAFLQTVQSAVLKIFFDTVKSIPIERLALHVRPSLELSNDQLSYIVSVVDQSMTVTMVEDKLRLYSKITTASISISSPPDLFTSTISDTIVNFVKKAIEDTLMMAISPFEPVRWTEHVPQVSKDKSSTICFSLTNWPKCFLLLKSKSDNDPLESTTLSIILIVATAANANFNVGYGEQALDIAQLPVDALLANVVDKNQISLMVSSMQKALLPIRLQRLGWILKKLITDEYTVINAPLLYPAYSCSITFVGGLIKGVILSRDEDKLYFQVSDPLKLFETIHKLAGDILYKHQQQHLRAKFVSDNGSHQQQTSSDHHLKYSSSFNE